LSQKLDAVHRAVASRLLERIQRLASLSGRDADIASQSAAVAEWLATDQRKVEYIASLWVGRTGLPAARLRDYVERFSAACADHLRAELKKQGLPFDPHFMIWMVLERSLQRDDAAGAILCCLKEVWRSSLTDLEPALPLAPTDVTAPAEAPTPEPHRHQPRRLRRNDHASEADMRAYRSVSWCRGEGLRGPTDLARWRRLRCRLKVPDEWRRVGDRADHR